MLIWQTAAHQEAVESVAFLSVPGTVFCSSITGASSRWDFVKKMALQPPHPPISAAPHFPGEFAWKRHARTMLNAYGSDIVHSDVIAGRDIGQFSGHTDMIQFVLVHLESDRMFSGSSDRTLKVWDLTSRKVITQFKHDDTVTSISLNSAANVLVSGSRDGKLSFWQV